MRAFPASIAVLLVCAGAAWGAPAEQHDASGFILLEVVATAPGQRVEFIMDYAGPAIGFAAAYLNGTLTDGTVLLSNGVGTGFETGGSLGSREAVARSPVLDPGGWLTWAEFADPGTYEVLLFAGGDVEYWEFTPDPTVTWRVVGRGDVHALTSAEMHLGAWSEVHARGASAYAVQSGRFEFDVEHALVGFFAPDPPILPGGLSPYGIKVGASLEGPTGSDSCSCILTDPVGPPGSYEFRWNGAGVSVQEYPIVTYADVPFTRR